MLTRVRYKSASTMAKSPSCGIAGERKEDVFEAAAGELRTLGDDRVEGSVRNGASVMDYEQFRAELLDEMEQVRAENHRRAGTRPRRDRFPHAAHPGGIEA